MALILNIETSTNICSVALARNGKVLASRQSSEDKSHARLLAPFIEALFKEFPEARRNLQAISVSEGPGSYTGLRIGISTAKGLAYGLKIPLLAVSTLQAMADEAAKQTNRREGLYMPLIDARRKEVYTAEFDHHTHKLEQTRALVLEAQTFTDKNATRLFIFGDGAAKASNILTDSRISYLDIEANAIAMAPIAEQLFNNNQVVDVAYFEPFYLKDFIPTIPRKNVFK